MRQREYSQRTAVLRRLYVLCGAVAGLAIVAAGAGGADPLGRAGALSPGGVESKASLGRRARSGGG